MAGAAVRESGARAASAPQAASPALIYAALGVVYVVWGSTYLAIRVVVETIPALLGASARFLLAGAVCALVLVVRGGLSRLRIERREALGASIVGVLLLLGGNGLVSLAEQRDVPSGLAALIVAGVPLWVVLLRTLARERVPRLTLAGVALGLPGLAVLLLPGGRPVGVGVLGVLLVVMSSLLWAGGSFAGSRWAMPRDTLVSSTYQMLAGGLGLAVAGLLRGEPVSGLEVSRSSAVAWAYLVVAGSLLAFTAYSWLLQRAPISQVATYAYVNPVVAVVLGAVLLDERLTARSIVGGLLVVASVVVVTTVEARRRRTAAQD